MHREAVEQQITSVAGAGSVTAEWHGEKKQEKAVKSRQISEKQTKISSG